MRFRVTSLVMLAAFFGAMTASAHADAVTFTLTDPLGDLPATGGSLTFDATVSAPASNGAAVFLNGDSFNVDSPATLNDSDFFANFPFFLNPGDSFTGDLFVLTAPASSTPETFQGSFTILGGSDGNASNVLGTVDFTLTVGPESVATTPEPSSIVMLGTGLLGLAGVVRRRFV